MAEKINKFLRDADLTLESIITDYYVNFVIYYINTFMPLALFIAVILFTSKMANDTEVIAINSAQVSFTRFLRPYFIGASVIMVFTFFMNHFLVPHSNKERTEFERTYLSKKKRLQKVVDNFSIQLTNENYFFIEKYRLEKNEGINFSIEEYEGIDLKYKLTAPKMKWNPADSVYTLENYTKRYITKDKDSIVIGESLDTIFPVTPTDMVYKDYLAIEITSFKLYNIIKNSEARGVKNLNMYRVELYKRTSLPLSTYILTLMAVCLAFQKRRGGTGVNIAIGLALMFSYVFLIKVGEVLGAVSGNIAILYVWLPNILFGIIALYLFYYAKK